MQASARVFGVGWFFLAFAGASALEAAGDELDDKFYRNAQGRVVVFTTNTAGDVCQQIVVGTPGAALAFVSLSRVSFAESKGFLRRARTRVHICV